MSRRAMRVLGCVAIGAYILLLTATAAFATPIKVWSEPYEQLQLSGPWALAVHGDGSAEMRNIATNETRVIPGYEPRLSGDWMTWVEDVPRQDSMPESALHALQLSTGIARTLTSSETVGNGAVWGDWAAYTAGSSSGATGATETQFIVNLSDGRQWSIPYGVNMEVQGVSPTAAFVQEDDGSRSFWNLATGSMSPFPFETWIAQHDPSGAAGVARFYRSKLLIADESSAWSVDPVTQATTLVDKESDESAQPILTGAEAYGSDWGAWVGNPSTTAKHMMLMLGNLSTHEFRRLDVPGGAVDENGLTGDNFKGWSTNGNRVIYSVDRGTTDSATGTFVETITALPRVRRIAMKRTPSAATYVLKGKKHLVNKVVSPPSLRVSLVVTNDAGAAVPNATVQLHLRPKGWDDDVTLPAPKTDSKGRISLLLPNDYLTGGLSAQGLLMIGAWSHIGKKNDYLSIRWHVSAKSGAYFEAMSPWTKIKPQ